jgi:hypothetical protein
VKTYLLAISWISLLAFAPAYACLGNTRADSVANNIPAKTSTTRFTARLNSMGMFNYGGRIVSGNPSVDFMYVREARQLSIQAFKAFDLYNVHTDMNFAAAFLYRNLNVTKRLVVSPGAGLVVAQTHSIADKGSDLAARVVLSYKISSELTLEHTALVTNLALKTDDLDWVNRFRVTYSKKFIDASVTVWHNNKVFDNTAYLTTAINLTYARVRISDHMLLNTGVTSVIMPYSNNKELYPKKNGVFLTVAVVVH